jgi:hypothetical protein
VRKAAFPLIDQLVGPEPTRPKRTSPLDFRRPLGTEDAEQFQRIEGRAAQLVAEGITAVPLALEVTDPASVSATAALIERDHGRLDILVNNAGVLLERGQHPSQMAVELLERTYATNVYGVVAPGAQPDDERSYLHGCGPGGQVGDDGLLDAEIHGPH